MTTLTDQHPKIVTRLPGPKTAALLEKDQQYISPSYTRGYPLSIAKGEGAMVTDLDGNRFLDFCAGIAVCATGHSHPAVVAAITEQAQQFLHMSGTDFYYQNMVNLAEKLAHATPGSPDKKVFFANSGTEAIEGSLKLARYHTGRQKIVSFLRSFHGRTFGAMSISASKTVHKKGFSPLLPGVLHAPFPYFFRDPQANTPEECAKRCLAYIETSLFKYETDPSEVAAFIVEPIQGEGGYVPAPANFLPGLQALAKKHGILVIADEVQSGMGRTGKMWASCHYPGFEPDIIASAKGLASGLPLGAIIAKSSVMNWPPGAHATTFGGNPVSCAAALKTFDLLEGGLVENARIQGEYIISRLNAMRERIETIGDVRGMGLMIGIEMVKNKTTLEKAPQLRDTVVDACYEEGLLILGCGENTIRFCPPLVITREQADIACDIFEQVVSRQQG